MVKQSGWDIDLVFGEKYEKAIKDIFEGKGKIEIKTERDKWKTTGNIVIEVEHNGLNSGLTITQADWWLHNLTLDGDIVMAFLIPVKQLKRMVIKALTNEKAILTKGGDDNKATIVLLPINYLTEVIYDENG